MSDYKATAAQLAAIANAIRLKGGTSAALEYPSEWISAITNLTPASGGSEITPQDPTAEYKVTDTELTAIASAIRTKGETSALLEFPDEFVSAIEAISGGGGGSVDIVPWSTGTDEQIAAMVAALDAGTLTIADTGWQIGDERACNLSAMAASGVPETHAAQTVTLVLMDSQHFDLVTGGKDHFVVGLKNCLNEKGRIHWNTAVVWKDSERRAWCNGTFYNSIPQTIRSCFKQFKCISAAAYNNNTINTTDDYFSLFAEKEMNRNATTSTTGERNALSDISYYANADNRKKKIGNSYGDYWTRSVDHSYSNKFATVNANGGLGSSFNSSLSQGIAPFGCI